MRVPQSTMKYTAFNPLAYATPITYGLTILVSAGMISSPHKYANTIFARQGQIETTVGEESEGISLPIEYHFSTIGYNFTLSNYTAPLGGFSAFSSSILNCKTSLLVSMTSALANQDSKTAPANIPLSPSYYNCPAADIILNQTNVASIDGAIESNIGKSLGRRRLHIEDLTKTGSTPSQTNEDDTANQVSPSPSVIAYKVGSTGVSSSGGSLPNGTAIKFVPNDLGQTNDSDSESRSQPPSQSQSTGFQFTYLDVFEILDGLNRGVSLFGPDNVPGFNFQVEKVAGGVVVGVAQGMLTAV